MLKFLNKPYDKMSNDELTTLYYHVTYNLNTHRYYSHSPNSNLCCICEEYVRDLEDVKEYLNKQGIYT
jgi:hypothetical protein